MSHRPYRPPHALPTAPELWCRLFGSEVLSVPRETAYTWWSALNTSVWTNALALKGLFMLPRTGPTQEQEHYWITFFREQLTPARLVTVTEDLVHEGALSRHEATAVEEKIFARTTPEGKWKTPEGYPVVVNRLS